MVPAAKQNVKRHTAQVGRVHPISRLALCILACGQEHIAHLELACDAARCTIGTVALRWKILGPVCQATQPGLPVGCAL